MNFIFQFQEFANMNIISVLFICGSLLLVTTHCFSVYNIDDSVGLGRRFDGIGGLSGGSATSKLLMAYKEKERNEILDYLFKPNFAAALQILKVEIGGDSQSSDATEASHMHNIWDENYNRGYEWWLMKEAKKRNPDIKLYGLPWNFPGWLGNGTQNPYENAERLATYIMKWVRGAKQVHGLTIDLIGIWNEKAYNKTYIETLRQVLDEFGYSNTRIVAADYFGWGLADDIIQDSKFAAAFDYIGVHYPGTESSLAALQTGKQLWSSEDYSSYNDLTGGGCWARLLNWNYVNGFMTSTIAWNLIDSYYQGLPWDRDSLMTARQPWSGNYNVSSPIWTSAHTTQFTQIGWTYLRHGSGVGMFDLGGSYVSLVSPDGKDLSIIIETMSHNHSVCIRPALPPYTVDEQTVILNLKGSFANIQELNVWYSKLRFDGGESVYMEKLSPLKVRNGRVELTLGIDELFTLTTLITGHRGDYGPPPPPAQFTLPFEEDFEDYEDNAEPLLLAMQSGSFEVVPGDKGHGKVMRQMVLERPVIWCTTAGLLDATVNLLGSVNWTDIYVEVDLKIGEVNGTTGVYMAARITHTGCWSYKATGIFFYLFPNDNLFLVTNDLAREKIITGGREYDAVRQGWNNLYMLVKNGTVIGGVNGKPLFNITVPTNPPSGFVGVGTDSYGIADFDNLKVATAAEGEQLIKKKNMERKDFKKLERNWWKSSKKNIKLKKKIINRNRLLSKTDNKLYYVAKSP
ncbi:galactocerebrosidase-like isoform X3 [Gigantopelta aegis]|uniref:galactocerebrosidase-like isoform X3 n=1 Tax=Gigantopelta aegis TaxID=1735272 RepID=UPI001B888492|nr:galactocerebrosidase-like isoform X3 [Gigantopelta aegis]